MAATDAAFSAVSKKRLVERAGRFLIFSALIAWLSGCGETSVLEDQASAGGDQPEPSSLEPSSLELSPDRMGQWARNCALCHVRGEGGAPVLGDEAAWRPRFAQGDEVLLKHTVEGLNNMPPLGYCMDCEEDDFRALIQFFSRSSGGVNPAGEES